MVGYLLPGVVTKEKNIILTVNKYKLPAWSLRILQQAFKAKHVSKLTSQLIIAAEFGDIQWSSKGPWFVNLPETRHVNRDIIDNPSQLLEVIKRCAFKSSAN